MHIHLTTHNSAGFTVAIVTPAQPTSRSVHFASVPLLRLRGWGAGVLTQKRRFATVAAGVLAVAVGYHVVFGHNGLTAYRQKQQDFHSLDLQMKQLTKENQALKGHVDRLQEDPDAIVHQAREELHYARPGEVIVTLPPEKAARPVK